MGLWVFCWNKDAVFAVDGAKGLTDQKCTDESVKDQGVDCVFWLERHCPSRICITWSDGKLTVVPGSSGALEGCCAQEEAWIVGKQDLEVAPRQCAGSRIAPHPQLSGKNQTSVMPHPPYSPDLAPAEFFLFSKLKTTLKGRRFKTTEEFRKMR